MLLGTVNEGNQRNIWIGLCGYKSYDLCCFVAKKLIDGRGKIKTYALHLHFLSKSIKKKIKKMLVR